MSMPLETLTHGIQTLCYEEAKQTPGKATLPAEVPTNSQPEPPDTGVRNPCYDPVPHFLSALFLIRTGADIGCFH